MYRTVKEVIMSAKTKIVVLHMRNLIFTGVVIGVGILLLLLLFVIYIPNSGIAAETMSDSLYKAGIYTSSVQLGDEAMDVQVMVDENHINSISLVNASETVQTMYPLIKPALADLEKQIIDKQSTEDLSYSENSHYTSMVLVTAINKALEKAGTK